MPPQLDERALGHRAGQADGDHRVFLGQGDGMHRGLPGFVRQLGLGEIDLVAHVRQRLVGIETRHEFQGDRGMSLAGIGRHFLDALYGLQFVLHGPHQHALGVFGRDARVGDGHVDIGNGDVRFRFLGYAQPGRQAGSEQQQEQQRHGALVHQRPVDEPVHVQESPD